MEHYLARFCQLVKAKVIGATTFVDEAHARTMKALSDDRVMQRVGTVEYYLSQMTHHMYQVLSCLNVASDEASRINQQIDFALQELGRELKMDGIRVANNKVSPGPRMTPHGYSYQPDVI